MIASLLEFSLRQRILILGVAGIVSFAGVLAFQSLPIDAYPDVTNIQVQVLTEAPGLSPVEVERFITYPLELQMTGLPGLAEIRSLSKFALSQVTVVFQDDVDIYFARQLVLERMIAAKERLPEGVEPVMAPVSTGLGEVYQYYLVGPHAKDSDEAAVQGELTEQRTLQDWVLRPLFKGIPGVIAHGRYDVVCPVQNAWDLHKAWPEAKLEIAPLSGHSAFEPELTDILVRATDSFR